MCCNKPFFWLAPASAGSLSCQFGQHPGRCVGCNLCVQDVRFGLTHVGHAGLQGSSKERFNEIQQELSQLSTKFSNNLLDATKAFKKLLKDPAEVQLVFGFYSLCCSWHRPFNLPVAVLGLCTCFKR